MTGSDDWRSAVVQLDANDTDEAMVELFATALPDVLGTESWFAVPMAARTVEVGQQSAALVRRLAALEAPRLSVRPTARPASLDPSSFPDGAVWPGFAGLLCDATIAARAPLAERGTYYPVLHADLDALVRAVAARAAPQAADEVLHAAASWLGRVAMRRRGMESEPAPPAPENIVAGARGVHVHIVQLCGADGSARRLDEEIELISRSATG